MLTNATTLAGLSSVCFTLRGAAGLAAIGLAAPLAAFLCFWCPILAAGVSPVLSSGLAAGLAAGFAAGFAAGLQGRGATWPGFVGGFSAGWAAGWPWWILWTLLVG